MKSQTYKVNAKRLTPTSVEVCSGAAGKGAKSGKVFFRTRSPKDVWAKVNKRKNVTSPENASNRQSPLLGEAAKKRYSREFEDLPVECLRNCSTPLSFSQRHSQGSRSPSNPSPSLDDMILEIEREAHGPDYQYAPPSDDSEDGESVTYLPMRRVAVGHRTRASTVSTGSNVRVSSTSIGSLRASLSPSGKEERKKDPIYDYLEPQTKSSSPPVSTPLPAITPLAKTENCENGVGEGSYVRLQPPSSTVEHRTSPDGEDCVTYSYPVLPDEVLHHQYEYLPPADACNEEPAEGFESYIYMAPSSECGESEPTMNSPLGDTQKRKSDSDFLLNSRPLEESAFKNSSSQQLASRTPKKAVICEQPKVLETRHEPNIKMEPAKPILTQFAGEDPDLVFTNKLDKYLQEELDTIRQAFQIRLSQMEKRYQRQLASMNHTRLPQQMGSPSSIRASVPNIQTTRSSGRGMHRTASWHGIASMAENSCGNGQEASLSTGFDSGSEESLLSGGGSSICSEQAMKHFSSKAQNEDLPENKAHQVVQERMQEYKVRMMEFLMDRADAKIAAMEKQYQQQFLKLQQENHTPTPHLSSNQLTEQPGTFV